jgi:hypothetical protein
MFVFRQSAQFTARTVGTTIAKNYNICIPTKLVDFPASLLSESNAIKVTIFVFQRSAQFMARTVGPAIAKNYNICIPTKLVDFRRVC